MGLRVIEKYLYLTTLKVDLRVLIYFVGKNCHNELRHDLLSRVYQMRTAVAATFAHNPTTKKGNTIIRPSSSTTIVPQHREEEDKELPSSDHHP